MISKLIENELAYQADDGDVNFAVRLLPRYGQLSGKSLDELNVVSVLRSLAVNVTP
jgi:cysteinyl-tRNA synthetase